MEILLVVLCLLLLGVVIWMLARSAAAPRPDPELALMQRQVDALRDQVSQSLSHNASLLQKQLEHVGANLRNSSGEINLRLDNAAKLYGQLSGQLGQLSQANSQ